MTSSGSNPVAWTVIVLAATLLISALANLQLFQDGASYLVEFTISGSAIRHERLGAYIIQAPLIISRNILRYLGTDAFSRLATQRLVFSLNYAAVPLAAILTSWLVVRGRDERLFFWSVLIILFVNVVNFSWVSELLIAMQLACPLMLACFLHPHRRLTWVLAPVLGALIFFLHPLSFLLFLVIGIGCFVAGFDREAKRRTAFFLGAVLLVTAGLRGALSLWRMSDYEKSMVEPVSMREYLLVTTIANGLFLLCALAIGVNRLLSGRSRSSMAVDVALAVIGCVILISSFVSGVAGFPLKTGLALFASMVLILFASIDSRQVVAETERLYRLRLGFLLSLGFAAVILTKSWIWWTSITTLERTLVAADAGCVERSQSDLQWLDHRPGNILDNWALPSLVLVRQVGDPTKYFLPAGGCAAFQHSGNLPIDPWTVLSLADLRPFTARQAVRDRGAAAR